MAIVNRRNGLRLGAAGNLGGAQAPVPPPSPGSPLVPGMPQMGAANRVGLGYTVNPQQYAAPLGGPPTSIYGQREPMGVLNTIPGYNGFASGFAGRYGLARQQVAEEGRIAAYGPQSRETTRFGVTPGSLTSMDQVRGSVQQSMGGNREYGYFNEPMYSPAMGRLQAVDARYAANPVGRNVVGGQYVQGAMMPMAPVRTISQPTIEQERAFPAQTPPGRAMPYGSNGYSGFAVQNDGGSAMGRFGVYAGQPVQPGAGLAMMPTGSPGNMMPSRAEMATRRQERSARRAEVQAQETAMRQQNHLRSLYGAGRAPLPVGAGFGSAAPAPVNGTPGTGMVPVEEAQAAMKRSGLSDEEIRKRLLGLGYSEQQVGAPSLRWDPMPNVRWQPPQTYQVGPFGR